MSKYSIDSTTLSAIATAIKNKSGNNNAILVSNFASAIANLPSGGGDLSITRIYGQLTQCWFNNMKQNWLLPIGSYLPSDLDKLKVLIGLSNAGISMIWYNNSSNLIEGNVSSYINASGSEITNAGTCPILTNAYAFSVGHGTLNDRNPDSVVSFAVIGGQVYTVTKSGNNYIYQASPEPGTGSDYIDFFIIKEA